MKRIFFASVSIFVLSFYLHAQSARQGTLPDFSGTWVLDEDKSVFPDLRENALKRVAAERRNDKDNYEDYSLVISQKGVEIVVLQSYTYKGKPAEYRIVLYGDKRGESNVYPHKAYDLRNAVSTAFWLEDVNVKSRSFFEKGKLARTGQYKAKVGIYNHVLRQTYELSRDRKVLTVFSDLQIMAADALADQRSTLIFRRVEK